VNRRLVKSRCRLQNRWQAGTCFLLTCDLSWGRIGVLGLISDWRLEHETPPAKSFVAILIRCGWKSPVTRFRRPERQKWLAKQTTKALCAIFPARAAGVGTPRVRQRALAAGIPSRLRRLLPPLGRMLHLPRIWNAPNAIRHSRLEASSAVSAGLRFPPCKKQLSRNRRLGQLRPNPWLCQPPQGSPHKSQRQASLGRLLRWLAPLGRHRNPRPQSLQARRRLRRSPVLSPLQSALP